MRVHVNLRSTALAIAAAALLSAADPSTAVDEILKEWNKPDSPGASVAVVQHGKLVFSKGYGIANLEYGIPIKPETVFHVASVSKQFTAMALVLLEQKGKLSIEDDIRKYLTELPDYGTKVTIRQLLQHTSGIRDQWQTLAIAGWRLDDVITQKQILRMMAHQKELNFPPGSEHLYSNGGYTLAAEIVARASGDTFPEFCRKNIFEPLGMTNTHFHDDHKRVVPNRAYSYGPSKGSFEASPLNYANAGATSLFTTGPDLAKWLDNFREPKVGGRAGVDRLQEQGVLTTGRKIDYALGVSMGKYRGLKTVSHGGADAGYRSVATWYPEHETGVVVLSNLGSFNPGGIANKVAAAWLGDKMEPESAKPPADERQYTKVDSKTLEKYVGWYKLGEGRTLEVQVKDGTLRAAPVGQPPAELKPLAANRFFAPQPNVEVEFTQSSGGKVSIKVLQGGSELQGERTEIVPFDAKDLPLYTGNYWSEELETRYTIRVKDDKLVADHAHHGEIDLRPIAKDQFRGSSWFFSEISFIRDSSGKITGLKAGGGRIRGIAFSRQ